MTAAWIGGKNADGTPIPNLPDHWSIAVNDAGSFFNQRFRNGGQYDPLRIAGVPFDAGSTVFQAETLLHEIGHLLHLLKDDTDNATLSKDNDDTVVRNCGDLLVRIH